MDNNQNDVEKTSSEQQVEETATVSSNQPEETVTVSSEHAEAAANVSSEQTDTAAKTSSEQTDTAAKASSEQTDTTAKASSEQTDTTANASSEQTDTTAKASSEQTDTTANASSEKKQGAAKTSTAGQKTAKTASSQSKTTTGSTARRTTTRKTTSTQRNTAQKSTASRQTAKTSASKEETSEKTADESDSGKKKGSKDIKMTISGHLKELRNRVAICFIFLVIAFLIALYFSQDVINFLTDMGSAYNYTFVYIAPQELLMQQFSISLVVAICVTLPLILYHVWAYVQPALKKREKTMFLAAIISGLFCFVIGVLFAYYIMLPFMLRFLIGLSSGTNISASISVKEYLNFETTIFIVMGFIFEMPVLFVILTQLGLLKVEWLRKGFKYAIIVIFVIAALVTPPDIVSQSMVALPMIGLYWISILISSALLRFKPKKAEDDDEDDDDEDDD